MKIPKIATFTLNPAIDYYMSIDKILINETNKVNDTYFEIGGKGINVSMVLNTLGVKTTVYGFVGGFTGNEIINQLNSVNISNKFIYINNNTRINVKLKNSQITELNNKGPYISDIEKNKLLDNIDSDLDLIIISGSMPKNCEKDFYSKIVNRASTQFIIDTTGNMLKNTLQYRPLLVKPNIQELKDFFECEINCDRDIISYSQKLIDMGAKNVIVSMGKDGAILVNNDIVIKKANIDCKCVNTVGCGDSMVAGFVYGFVNGLNIDKCFEYAMICGNACAMSKGLPKIENIEYIKTLLFK